MRSFEPTKMASRGCSADRRDRGGIGRRAEEYTLAFVLARCRQERAVDAVREAMARTLLQDASISLVDVAERLGFSDLASFSRAFKRWTGLPPGTFRRTR